MLNEKQIIKQVLKGDSSSFGFFVDQYQDMALTIAFRILKNRQEAEDVVQNAFVKAYYNMHTYSSKSKFSTWFYRIVYNTAITTFNKIKKRGEADYIENLTEDSQKIVFESNENSELQERKESVNKAVERLPKNEAIVVTLYYLEEYSVSEIAEIMTLTKSNVKIILFRARKKLHDILK
jgi:RNA polymerase sigma-70 factor (ECF subfamily)